MLLRFMEKFAQQTITKPERSLAELIKRLADEIKKLPAYARRKKDEKNWETFFTIFAFIALAGIIIFGSGGWMAVAVSGALLTLIIVESGLFLSLAIGFSAWPIYNLYLWTRDLFSSAEIKAENKQYAQLEKTIAELKTLNKQQNKLDEKINSKLECIDGNLVQTTGQENSEKFLELPENKKPEYVYKLFHKSTVPANQPSVDTNQSNTQRNLI
jgi:hypothetical protein